MRLPDNGRLGAHHGSESRIQQCEASQCFGAVAVLASGKIGVGVNHSLAIEQAVAMYEKSVSAIEKCENKQQCPTYVL